MADVLDQNFIRLLLCSRTLPGAGCLVPMSELMHGVSWGGLLLILMLAIFIFMMMLKTDFFR